MREICVSVPTDDGEIVKLGHFGDAKYYYHYVKEINGEWSLRRIVENPYTGQHEHGDEEESRKRPRIYELNKECTYIVATAFGAWRPAIHGEERPTSSKGEAADNYKASTPYYR